MSRLPYSRIVNVTLSRNDAFPTRRGFGVLLLLSTIAIVGVLDAANPTKVYGSIEEVATDHDADTEVYQGALAAFSQNPRPMQIKVGYIDFDPVAGTGPELQTALDNLYERDSAWYWLTITKSLRDLAALDAAFDWTLAKNKLALFDTNDPLHKDVNDTTNISARNKGETDRGATFYSEVEDQYPAVALAGYLGTFNFDQANTAYTAKAKRLRGISVLNAGSAAVQAITGFTPALGQSVDAGHMANAYVDIGGQPLVVEGSTLTPNVFIDEIHATDWIIARTEEETLSVLLNNARVPYTDQGMELLASGARTAMQQARRAGLIADDLDPETGVYAPSVQIEIPSVFDVPESQRKARIAPEIRITFRYAGAVHYTTIVYRMTF